MLLKLFRTFKQLLLETQSTLPGGICSVRFCVPKPVKLSDAMKTREKICDSKTTITANITNASAGEITLTMSNSATSALAAGRFVYDVEITQTSGGAKTRVIEGQITVHPQVTST